MKNEELRFDRNCHILYSREGEKEIKKKIALHYPESRCEEIWTKVQLKYVEFLSEWRTDLGGEKNFHNGKGGTYDCIAIMTYYVVCKAVTFFREIEEIEEIEENLVLPSFRKLKFVDCSKMLRTSYTTFEYSDFSVTEKREELIASVKIRNIGDKAGKEAVQIYMQGPYTEYDKQNGIERPAIELAGFEKTKMLEANEEVTVNVTVPKKNMRVYDAVEAKIYIVEASEYYFPPASMRMPLSIIYWQNGGMEAGTAALVAKYDIVNTDKTTYAVCVNVVKIENQFENADINYYKKGVKYLSRSDGEGTFPTLYSDGVLTANSLCGRRMQ